MLLHLTLKNVLVIVSNFSLGYLLLLKQLLSQNLMSLVPNCFLLGILFTTHLFRPSKIVQVLVVDLLLFLNSLLLKVLKPLLVCEEGVIVKIIIKIFQLW